MSACISRAKASSAASYPPPGASCEAVADTAEPRPTEASRHARGTDLRLFAATAAALVACTVLAAAGGCSISSPLNKHASKHCAKCISASNSSRSASVSATRRSEATAAEVLVSSRAMVPSRPLTSLVLSMRKRTRRMFLETDAATRARAWTRRSSCACASACAFASASGIARISLSVTLSVDSMKLTLAPPGCRCNTAVLQSCTQPAISSTSIGKCAR
mmetsp:Transcript_8308/g.18152  ORF Transcript_8308/g.18152 Transcript_8308/m.18152 type:complete len:219 (+) Transcript_8308:1627-2283(+)